MSSILEQRRASMQVHPTTQGAFVACVCVGMSIGAARRMCGISLEDSMVIVLDHIDVICEARRICDAPVTIQ